MNTFHMDTGLWHAHGSVRTAIDSLCGVSAEIGLASPGVRRATWAQQLRDVANVLLAVAAAMDGEDAAASRKGAGHGRG
jgi:hypothetical protein